MSLEYPLEQICSHKSERTQQSFARNAMPYLPTRQDRVFLERSQGLVILGETEDAMEAPVRALRDMYGDDIEIGPLTIRYRPGDTVQEPYMGVRVSAPVKHFDAIRADLLARGASVVDAERIGPLGVVRATAPLAALMGYAKSLAELTSGRANQVMWFSHYAPVRRA
jgi:hypothetical protein